MGPGGGEAEAGEVWEHLSWKGEPWRGKTTLVAIGSLTGQNPELNSKLTFKAVPHKMWQTTPAKRQNQKTYRRSVGGGGGSEKEGGGERQNIRDRVGGGRLRP